jgi:hypothetical protein
MLANQADPELQQCVEKLKARQAPVSLSLLGGAVRPAADVPRRNIRARA